MNKKHMLTFHKIRYQLVVVLLKFTVGGKSSKDEPNQIPHWIPIIGHAFRFALNKREFFLWAEYVNNGLLLRLSLTC